MEDETSDNMVLVGRKPVMNYVVACLTLFNSGRSPVIVRARGQAISRAVDTVELLKKAFVKNLSVQSINIGTQQFIRPGNIESSIPTIEIMISRPSSRSGRLESVESRLGFVQGHR